jgi:hypothetical protein
MGVGNIVLIMLDSYSYKYKLNFPFIYSLVQSKYNIVTLYFLSFWIQFNKFLKHANVFYLFFMKYTNLNLLQLSLKTT